MSGEIVRKGRRMNVDGKKMLLLVKRGMEAVIDEENDAGRKDSERCRLAAETRQEAMRELRESFPLPKVGRLRKEVDPETRESILFRYYMTEMSMAAISESLKLSNAVVSRIIEEHGKAWNDENREAVGAYRGRRYGGLSHVPRGK